MSVLYPTHCHTIIVEIAILIPQGWPSQSCCGMPSARRPALTRPKLVLNTELKKIAIATSEVTFGMK